VPFNAVVARVASWSELISDKTKTLGLAGKFIDDSSAQDQPCAGGCWSRSSVML
jgi:hypothetical protein